MKYFLIGAEIDEIMFEKFIEFLNEVRDEVINIVLKSSGGSNHFTRIITSIINFEPSKFILTSVQIYSAAFTLFYSAKCKRQIVKNTIGCYHKAYLVNIDLDVTKQPVWAEHKCLVNNLTNRDKSSISLKFMTKKELKLFNEGKDVFFTFKRMKEIFPDAEII